MNILLYVYTLITLAIVDGAWLYTMFPKYKQWIGHLLSPTTNMLAAVSFYLLYTFGVLYFIILPAIKSGSSNLQIFLTGALFGLIAYATYDLTNHATLRDWPVLMTLVDMFWGAILTGTSSLIVVMVYKYFN